MSGDRDSPHGHRAHARPEERRFGAAVLTVSTAGAAGERDDATGPTIVEALGRMGFRVEDAELTPDDRERIVARLRAWVDDPTVDVVVTTGGTGLTPSDVTPEATADVIDRPIPGITEAIRLRGLDATPLAALSRGIAGLAGRTLIVNLPAKFPDSHYLHD
ncbi:MAG: molybdenum cofactor synthesis domain-containing protein, partial [Acidobacteriota bacterium]